MEEDGIDDNDYNYYINSRNELLKMFNLKLF